MFPAMSFLVLLALRTTLNNRLCWVAVPFHERSLDMMLGDELPDTLDDDERHWHGLDQIAASICKGFSFGRISRYTKNFIGMFRKNGA